MYEITAALQLILVYAARAEDLDGAKALSPSYVVAITAVAVLVAVGVIVGIVGAIFCCLNRHCLKSRKADNSDRSDKHNLMTANSATAGTLFHSNIDGLNQHHVQKAGTATKFSDMDTINVPNRAHGNALRMHLDVFEDTEAGTGTGHTRFISAETPQARNRAQSIHPRVFYKDDDGSSASIYFPEDKCEEIQDRQSIIADHLPTTELIAADRRGSRRQSEWCEFQNQIARNAVTASLLETVKREQEEKTQRLPSTNFADTTQMYTDGTPVAEPLHKKTVSLPKATMSQTGYFYQLIPPSHDSVPTASISDMIIKPLRETVIPERSGTISESTRSRPLPTHLTNAEKDSVLYDVYFEGPGREKNVDTMGLESKEKPLSKDKSYKDQGIIKCHHPKFVVQQMEKSSSKETKGTSYKNGHESLITHHIEEEYNAKLRSQSSIYEDMEVGTYIEVSRRPTALKPGGTLPGYQDNVSEFNQYEEVIDDGFTTLNRGRELTTTIRALLKLPVEPTDTADTGQGECQDEYEYCIPSADLNFTPQPDPKIESPTNIVIARALKSFESSMQQSSINIRSTPSKTPSSVTSGGGIRCTKLCRKHKSCGEGKETLGELSQELL